MPVGVPELVQHRERLQADISALKESVSPKVKPLGARLDAARAALARAHKRREEAEMAVKAANDVLDMAVKEVASFESSIAALELELALPPQQQPKLSCVEEVSSKLAEM
eukprot:13038519-Alexandrium_andersonii.AAC.1